jgi:hypothetical protein
MRWGLVAVLVVWAIASTTGARGQDGPIDLAKVPAKVRKAAEVAVPGAKLTSAFKGVEDGATYYELSGKNPQGRAVEIEVTASGRVEAVETAISFREVPRVVLDALRAKMKGFKPETAEVVTQGGKLVGYEFEGEDPQGDDIEVQVSPDGKQVEVEDAEGD